MVAAMDEVGQETGEAIRCTGLFKSDNSSRSGRRPGMEGYSRRGWSDGVSYARGWTAMGEPGWCSWGPSRQSGENARFGGLQGEWG